VWKRWLFSVTLRGGHVIKHCTATEIIDNSKFIRTESEGVPTFKGQLKFVNGSVFERYMP
jgi:hypothetical protein